MPRKIWILLAVTPTLVVVDQLTKIWIRSRAAAYVAEAEEAGRRAKPTQWEHTVIPDFFDLIYAKNPGAAWGLMANYEHRLVVFLVVSVVAFVVIGLYYRTLTDRDNWLAAALALILSGAIGNFIDRVRFGFVTDFLDFYVGWEGSLKDFISSHSRTVHYPTFNVADIAIVVGVGIFLIHVLVIETFRRPPEDGDEAEDDGDESLDEPHSEDGE